jgi:hypothetical protein
MFRYMILSLSGDECLEERLDKRSARQARTIGAQGSSIQTRMGDQFMYSAIALMDA